MGWALFQLDAEMLFHRLFDRPGPLEPRLHHKSIARPQGHRRPSLGGDRDLPLDQMNEFVKLVGRVPGAQRRLPRPADHAAVQRGMLNPGFHRRVAVNLGPAFQIGQHRFRPRRGQAENSIAHISPFGIAAVFPVVGRVAKAGKSRHGKADKAARDGL